MARKDWKIGEECWYFSDIDKRIKRGTILGLREHIDSTDMALLENVDTLERGLWPVADIFPTREELCEYYRKIFE